MEYPLKFKVTIPAKFEFFTSVYHFWNEIGKKIGVEKDILHDVCVVLEEHCANVVRYAYKKYSGDVSFEFYFFQTTIKIAATDFGVEFNKEKLEEAQMKEFDFDDSRIGGMGLPLMKILTSKIDYSRDPQGVNTWQMEIKRKENDMQSFEIKEINKVASLVKVTGQLDSDLAERFNPKMREIVSNKKLIIVDMSKLEFMASAGLGVFLYAIKNLKKNDGQMWLVNVQPGVMKVFKLTRVESLFTFYDSMEEAKKNIPE